MTEHTEGLHLPNVNLNTLRADVAKLEEGIAAAQKVLAMLQGALGKV